MKNIEDFTGLLGSNIKTITYVIETNEWLITYNNGRNSDIVDNEDILDFLIYT